MKRRISISYELLRVPVWIGSRLFYRKFTVHGMENMPDKSQATILISNHQNGMMDPVMSCVTSRRQLHFLTRADLFKGKLANRILRHLNMLPVYRERDRVSDLAGMNGLTFDTSYDRILNGNVISMFPEGNHNNKKWIRPFRKGISRVTFGAMQKAEYQRDIQIIPVGIDYTAYTKFRGDILLNFGKPISTLKYADLHRKEPAKALSTLTRETNAALKALVINVEDKENYDWIMATQMIALETHPDGDLNDSDHLQRVKGFQDFLSKWIKTKSVNEELIQQIVEKSRRYVTLRDKLKLSERAIWDNGKNCEVIFPLIGIILISPLTAIGVILNFVPAFITRQFVSNQVKDPHFTSSITLAVGIVFFAIFWFFQAIILSMFVAFPWTFLITLLAAPICGIIAIESWRLFNHILAILKLRSLLRKKNDNALTLSELRAELVSHFKQISKND